MKIYFIILLFISAVQVVQSQDLYPYNDTDLDFETRAADIVSRLSLEEKISLLMHKSPAIERLGIEEYNWWNECLHGVARAGYATVFPQSLSLAASWNQDLVYAVSTAISDEARAKHHEYDRRGQRGYYQGLTCWSPNINIFRDPRWGRGHETYGEDPFLTGQLAAQFVKGLQGDDPNYYKVIATAKHFAVHSGPEHLRHEFDVVVSERDLRETYLPAFKKLVTDANVYSIMCAYNSFEGEPACANTRLYDILRNEWGFKGYVVSDCGAIVNIWKDHKLVAEQPKASALALSAGCDLNCGKAYIDLKQAVDSGYVCEDKIDLALERLFLARFKLGMFDPADKVPYANIPFHINNHPTHNKLARIAARESIVLLKNDNLLPLSKNLSSIAVIGPNANDIQSLWGNYNGIPSNPVTMLQGIKNKVDPQTKVSYAVGSFLDEDEPIVEPIPSIYLETPDNKQGLRGEFFNNHRYEGEPLYVENVDNIDFNWDINTPDPRLKTGNFSIRWTGYIVPPVTGYYYLTDWGKPEMRITFQDTIHIGTNYLHHASIHPKKVYMETGKKYKIKVEYRNYYGDAAARLLWAMPDTNQLAKAVNLAEKSDLIVLVLGLNERLEGENGDRTSLSLPSPQVQLMKKIVNTGKPVVLVTLNGSPVILNWASENIPAILTAGYPGQQGGNAVADVLFGDYNPAGRLPVTYYASLDQLPEFEDYNMEGRTYRYFNDKPLYPFGYGLSYTQFVYSNLSIPKITDAKNPIHISVDVTNSGNLDGDEVVQLYLKDEKASTPRPIHQLEGFERIHLKKGETKTLNFTLEPSQLSMIDDKNQRVIEPGWFTLFVGGGQPPTKHTNTLRVAGVHGRFEVTRKSLEIK